VVISALVSFCSSQCNLFFLIQILIHGVWSTKLLLLHHLAPVFYGFFLFKKWTRNYGRNFRFHIRLLL
jgi:hypothetical protein